MGFLQSWYLNHESLPYISHHDLYYCSKFWLNSMPGVITIFIISNQFLIFQDFQVISVYFYYWLNASTICNCLVKRISCEEWEKLYHSHNAFICLLRKTFLYNRQKIKADYQNKVKNWVEEIKTDLSFTTLNVLII